MLTIHGHNEYIPKTQNKHFIMSSSSPKKDGRKCFCNGLAWNLVKVSHCRIPDARRSRKLSMCRLYVNTVGKVFNTKVFVP